MTANKMTKKKAAWQILFLTFLVVGTVMIILQQKNTAYQHDEGFIFGTIYHITYQSNEDRKSTRLNSSHANISYAVFCLKKNTTSQRPLLRLVDHTYSLPLR